MIDFATGYAHNSVEELLAARSKAAAELNKANCDYVETQTRHRRELESEQGRVNYARGKYQAIAKSLADKVNATGSRGIITSKRVGEGKVLAVVVIEGEPHILIMDKGGA